MTKDVLFATVWPDTVASDAVLAASIRELRRALDDPARSPHYIETVHGRGYRFIAAVVPLPQESANASAPNVHSIHEAPRLCPACQQVNALDASFCNACATPLDLMTSPMPQQLIHSPRRCQPLRATSCLPKPCPYRRRSVASSP